MLTIRESNRASGTLHFTVTLKTEMLHGTPASARHKKTWISQ